MNFMLEPFLFAVRLIAVDVDQKKEVTIMKKPVEEKAVKKVIGYRKSCKAEGVGLSHYILIAKDLKK